jgi:hypothetical protein
MATLVYCAINLSLLSLFQPNDEHISNILCFCNITRVTTKQQAMSIFPYHRSKGNQYTPKKLENILQKQNIPTEVYKFVTEILVSIFNLVRLDQVRQRQRQGKANYFYLPCNNYNITTNTNNRHATIVGLMINFLLYKTPITFTPSKMV